MPSPELDVAIKMMTSMQLHDADVETQREILASTATTEPPDGFVARQETLGGVPCEWIAAPGTEDGPILIYFHGGAYNLGSIATHRLFVPEFGRSGGGQVLMVEYRLAPEDPFPAAVDDGLAVYRAVLAQAIDPARIVLAGDSAGGGLAVATALAARDAGVTLPAGIVSISGWLDLRCSSDSFDGLADVDPLVTPAGLRQMGARYLGDTPADHPYASPVVADLSGLPPILAQVGTAEILLDDSRVLAERAAEAGVECQLRVWDDMPHVWPAMHMFLPEARQAVEEIGRFVREVTSV